MGLRAAVREWFKTTPPTKDAGYTQSPLISGNGQTYNPDELLSRKGRGIYDDMLKDEQLKAVYRFRRNATTAREWEFEFDEEVKDQLGEQEAQRRIDLFTQIIKRMPGSFKLRLDGVMSAMAYGYSLTNKVYEQFEHEGSTWFGIKTLRTKPAFTFTFKVDAYGNMLELRQQVSGRDEPMDIKRFIHYVVNPDVDEYYGRSELIEAYRAWFSKAKTIDFMNVHMERCASGFNVLTPAAGGTELTPGTPAHTRMQESLNSLRNSTGIIIPKNYTLTTTMPKGIEAFDKAIQSHDMALAKALLVPNLLGLSQQGDHGGYSQSQTQLEAFLWMLDSDAKQLEEALNEQLFDELGEINFGDKLYPYFCLLPLSKAQMYEALRVWRDLVTAGAAQASDTDEARVRKILGMPDKGTPLQPGVDPTQQPGNGGTPKQDGAGDKENGDTPPMPQEGDTQETIIGRSKAIIEYIREKFGYAETKPAAAHTHELSVDAKRVDFAAIAKGSALIETKHKHDLAAAMDALIKYGATYAPADGLENLTKFKFPSDLVKAVRTVGRKVLSDSWNLGEQEAAKETRIKTMRRMPDKNYAALRDKAAKYLDARSFLMAGSLTDDALALIKQAIVNGIKYSKSAAEIRTDIYAAAARKGMISVVLAKEALGDALGVEEPDYRLNTVIRTNTFDAINEARFDYFNDPDLKGFVEAMEYSAILDDRTTDICIELAGQTHAADDPGWDTYRPPNHFNCRSILVPVLKGDTWEESDWPTITPQEGFK